MACPWQRANLAAMVSRVALQWSAAGHALGRRRTTIARVFLVSTCCLAVSALFGIETLQHVEKRVLHRVEQKIVDKLNQKFQTRIDQFKQQVIDRWSEIRATWQRRVAGWGDRLRSVWRQEGDQISIEARSADLARFPRGIPQAEQATATASLVDAADTVSGQSITDPNLEEPSQIRFDERDADRSGSSPGEGDLADRPPEPATDVGNHASELPAAPAEVKAVRLLCSGHNHCYANPGSDAYLDPAQERLQLTECCRISQASGSGVLPDPVAGDSGGIPADALGNPGGLPIDGAAEPVVGGGSSGSGGLSGLAPSTQTESSATMCEEQCQTFMAMAEASILVLSDFDQTKHGADNQEGLGQLLPHRAAGSDRCYADPTVTLGAAGNTTVDTDLRRIGCELADDLEAGRGDVRAAFAQYIKHNHLPPINGAWPGQSLPARGPGSSGRDCAQPSPGAAVGGSNPAAMAATDSDVRDLVTTADCRTAQVPTGSLLTAVSRMYFDWNTHPADTLDDNPLDDGALALVAVPGGLAAPNEAQQVAAAAAYNAGFRGSDLLTATALAGSESNWNSSAVTRRPDGRTGYGLWRLTPDGTGNRTTRWSPEQLLDPAENALAAYAVSEPRGDFREFCSYWSSGRCGAGYPGSEAAPYRSRQAEANQALADLTMVDQGQGGTAPPVDSGGNRFGWPLSGPISQGFGCTPFGFEPFDPRCPTLHFHSGIDIAAACGTEIRAATSGMATLHTTPGGYGNNVTIDHGGGWLTLYGHMAGFAIANGAVRSGQVIGREGSTGNSTGCHLHFEVRHRGVPVAPLPLLS